jgi:hypothetical protein
MAISVSGSVQIYLNSQEDAEKVHEMINNIKEIVKERTKKNVYFEICGIKQSNRFVEFEVSSSRAQHGVWQVNQVIKELIFLIKKGVISGVSQFSAHLDEDEDEMEDYESWCIDNFQEEMEDYEGEEDEEDEY